MQALETVAPRTISSMSGHSVNQAITRGFKSSDILKVVKEGTATMGKSKFGNPQWRYMMNGNTVVIDAPARAGLCPVFNQTFTFVKNI